MAVRPQNEPRGRIALALGAAVVVDKPTVVRTVLGSCVAVILHVPRLGVSALCHAQMPERKGGPCSGSCPQPCQSAFSSDWKDLRYVSCCIRYMLQDLDRRGAKRWEIVCTLVGGANVIRNIDSRFSVANKNVATAFALLAQEGISVRYSDTGGTRGRVLEHTSDLNVTEVRYVDVVP